MEQNLIFPYRCEKCSSNSPTFNWRLILNMSMADCTDNQWINCFQETAESMLGMSSEDLGNLFVNDRAQYDSVFSAATFKRWIIRVRFVIFVIFFSLLSLTVFFSVIHLIFVTCHLFIFALFILCCHNRHFGIFKHGRSSALLAIILNSPFYQKSPNFSRNHPYLKKCSFYKIFFINIPYWSIVEPSF